MEDWLILGIIASLCFGVSGIVGKLVLSKEHFGVPLGLATVLSIIGIAIVFTMFYLLVPKAGGVTSIEPVHIMAAITIGLFWATGQVAIYYALAQGADVSRITPIFNTNTLVAVFLAILLLHELPSASDAVRVLVGAVMIVAGAILVAV